MKYVCHFNFYHPEHGKLHIRVSSKEGLDAFEYGFWINEDMEYTKGADAMYWIPPGQIKVIEKEPKDDKKES